MAVAIVAVMEATSAAAAAAAAFSVVVVPAAVVAVKIEPQDAVPWQRSTPRRKRSPSSARWRRIRSATPARQLEGTLQETRAAGVFVDAAAAVAVAAVAGVVAASSSSAEASRRAQAHT
jgi:hypothetical protein